MRSTLVLRSLVGTRTGTRRVRVSFLIDNYDEPWRAFSCTVMSITTPPWSVPFSLVLEQNTGQGPQRAQI